MNGKDLPYNYFRKVSIQMPEISRFFGIIIFMYFDEHNPPHFHVKYNEARAVLSISDLRVMEGKLPRRALSLVLE